MSTRARMTPNRWTGEPEPGESWTAEIEHDRMSGGEPMVVTVWARHHDGTDDHETLVCATPAVAREMATALRLYADLAEQANGAPTP